MLSIATPHDTAASAWPPLKLARGKLETHRAFPHAFIRSSLFSSRKFSGEAVREIATEENPIIIHTLSNYELVQVAGDHLDQGDCDVYMWLLNRAYQRGLSGKPEARIFFTREEAISERGRSRGTKMFRLFHESLIRLNKADIIYKTPYATGRTRLVSSIEEPTPESKKRYDYEIIISAKVGDFFHENDFRILKNEERAMLKDYLSKWLHAFYSSHKNPLKYKCDLIKNLADRGDTQERIWRKKLNAALANVKEATGWLTCEVVQEPGELPKIHVIKGERQFPKKDTRDNRADGVEPAS